MSEEMILVVPRTELDRLGAFQGLHFEVDRYLHAFFAPSVPRFLPRPAAELDPSFKQIIPYAILTHAGRILSYIRGAKGGEKRLNAKRSIGVGGHINDTDSGSASDGFDMAAYHRALHRELQEELHLKTAFTQRAVALLNDDSTEVGRVHLGVVHILECASAEVAGAEASLTSLEFLEPETLRRERDRLESWSQICVDHLETLLRP